MDRASIIYSRVRYFVAYLLSVRGAPCACPDMSDGSSGFCGVLLFFVRGVDFERSACS